MSVALFEKFTLYSCIRDDGSCIDFDLQASDTPLSRKGYKAEAAEKQLPTSIRHNVCSGCLYVNTCTGVTHIGQNESSKYDKLMYTPKPIRLSTVLGKRVVIELGSRAVNSEDQRNVRQNARCIQLSGRELSI